MLRGGTVLAVVLALGVGCGKDKAGPESRGSSQMFSDEGVLYALGDTEPYTGPVTDYHPNGVKSYQYEVINGKLQGTVTEWYKSRQKMTESTLKDGELVGVMTGWYKNGKKEYEMPLDGGEIHGTGTEYYESGQRKSQTPYVKGKREGREIGFDENDRKLWEADWKADRLHGEYVEFYPSGKRLSLKPYVAGVNKGTCTVWFENGERSEETKFDGDKPVGTHFEWYPNTKLKSQKTYSSSLLVRVAEWYDTGQKLREVSYSNGRPTSQKQWDAKGVQIVASGEASLPPVPGNKKPKTDPSTDPAKPNPNAPARRIAWQTAQLETVYKGKATTVLEKAFGAPDAKRGDTWVYNKMVIFDSKTRRRLNTVNFLIQDGLVVLVQCN